MTKAEDAAKLFQEVDLSPDAITRDINDAISVISEDNDSNDFSNDSNAKTFLQPQVLELNISENRLHIPFTIQGCLDENPVPGLIDSVAQVSMIEEDLAKYLLDSKCATSFPVLNRRVRGLTGEIFIKEAIQTTLVLPSGHVLADVNLLVIGCNAIGSPILIGADIIVSNNLEPNLAAETLYKIDENETFTIVNAKSPQKFKLEPIIDVKKDTITPSLYIVSSNVILEPMTNTKIVVELQGNESIPLQAVSFFEQIPVNKNIGYVLPPGVVYASPVMDVIICNPTESSFRLKSGKPILHLTECTSKQKQKLKVLEDLGSELGISEFCDNVATISEVNKDSSTNKNNAGNQSKTLQWTPEALAEAFKLGNNNLLNFGDKSRVTELLYKYSTTIATSDHDVGTTSILKHHIDLKTQRPVWIPVRRFQGKLEEEIEEECFKMLKEGIIRPSNSPYSAPIVPIRKKCGGLRLAVDYRALNKVTVPDKYPIPNITDMLYALHGANFFSSFDLIKGFFNLELDNESIPYTAFSTTRGHYEWTKLPFGLINSPASFQRVMFLALSQLPRNKCFIYLDDILIVSSTLEEHFTLLESLLAALLKAGLKINPKKCNLVCEKVNYLGYQVSSKGISPLPKNVDAIKNFPVPRSVKDVRRYLGMCNYFRKHIPDMATIAKPLSEVTGGTKLSWTEKMQESFEKLKTALVNPPVLIFPDRSLNAPPFLLQVDASGVGAGAVLLQERNGLNHPIAYISMSFSPQIQRYSATERELCAMRWAIKNLRPFLLGRKFIVFSDHQPLVYLQNMKLIDNRIARTLEDLAPYEFEIRYLPGRDNIVSDALSRAPLSLEMNSEDPNMADYYIPPNSSVHLMPGGGNSLFQALSTAFYGNDKQHLEIREKCIDELIRAPAKYNLKKQNKELKRMRVSGQYVMFEAIQAFANLNKINVLVYLGTPHPLAFIGEKCTEKKVYLQCLSAMHFNLIRLNDFAEKPKLPESQDWFMDDVDYKYCAPLTDSLFQLKDDREERAQADNGAPWWFNSNHCGSLTTTEKNYDDYWYISNVKESHSDETEQTNETTLNLYNTSQEHNLESVNVCINSLLLGENDLNESRDELYSAHEKDEYVGEQTTNFKELLIPYLSDDCLRRVQSEDPCISELFSIVSDSISFPINASDELCLFYKWLNKLSIENGILVRYTKHGKHSIISKAHLIQLITQLHENSGHVGRDKLFHFVIEHLWHPEIRTVIADICATCPVCQIYKSSSGIAVTPPVMKIQSLYPYNLVTVDLLELPPSVHGYKYILALIDHFSKFISLAPLRSKTAREVSGALRNRILGTLVAPPQMCAGDSGPEFRAGQFKEILDEFGIRQTRSPPRSPWVAGQIERSNRTIIQVQRILSASGSNWVQDLPKVSRQMNYTYQDSLKMSPSQYLLTHQHSTPIGPPLTAEHQQTWSPGSPKFVPYKEGDLVLKKNIPVGNRVSDKFSPKYLGLFRVTKVFSHGASYLITHVHTNKQCKSHFKHLKPFNKIPQYLLDNNYFLNNFLKPFAENEFVLPTLPTYINKDNIILDKQDDIVQEPRIKTRKQSERALKLAKMKERLIPRELYDQVTINPDGGLDVMLDDDDPMFFVNCPVENNVANVDLQGTSSRNEVASLPQRSLEKTRPFYTPGLIGSTDTTFYHGVDGGGDHTLESIIQTLNETLHKTIQASISNIYDFIDNYCQRFGIESVYEQRDKVSQNVSLMWDDELENSLREVNVLTTPVYTGDTTFFTKTNSDQNDINDLSCCRSNHTSVQQQQSDRSSLHASRTHSHLSIPLASASSFYQLGIGELSPLSVRTTESQLDSSPQVDPRISHAQELLEVSSNNSSPVQNLVHPVAATSGRLTRSAGVQLPPISLPDTPIEYSRNKNRK